MKRYRKSKCNQCGVEFDVINGRGKFCGLPCYHKALIQIDRNRVCILCNTPFISAYTKKYCSRKCQGKHLSLLQRTGRYNKCLICNKAFYVKKCHFNYKFCGKVCRDNNQRGKPNPKASDILSKMVANGTFNPKRNFYKQGWYTSKVTGIIEWFGSGYEQKRMLQLDNMGVTWTKKHGIRIPYIDRDGNKRNYVPDFLVDGKIIEEVKPSNLVHSSIDNNDLKYKAAIMFCEANSYQYRTITEKELKNHE